MAPKLRLIAPVLAVGAAASIALAPIASAADTTTPQTTCTDVSGTDTECQSPGNVQIDDSPPVEFTPQYPYWEGDYFGGYGHDGFHGGGGHR